MGGADLHIHSTASDGLLSTDEIIDWGVKKGLDAISITDHDSVSGIENAINYSMGKKIDVIPGIELSTEYNNVEVHMLGYFIDYRDKVFISFLDKLLASRRDRARQMVKKLKDLGYNIAYEDVIRGLDDAESIGRPHIARTMVKLGYCRSSEEVFERFIGFGKPAYVKRYKLSPFEALELIHENGGVASVAHPGLIINIDKVSLIKRLKDWGLEGIEIFHSKHTDKDVAYFKALSEKYDLIPTGGSDCHGQLTNGEPMLGSVRVPYKSVELLRCSSKRSTGNKLR